MTSEDIYRYNTRPALKALQLHTEEHLPEFAPLEGNPQGRPRHRAQASDNTEYKTKRAIRDLELALTGDDEEI